MAHGFYSLLQMFKMFIYLGPIPCPAPAYDCAGRFLFTSLNSVLIGETCLRLPRALLPDIAGDDVPVLEYRLDGRRRLCHEG